MHNRGIYLSYSCLNHCNKYLHHRGLYLYHRGMNINQRRLKIDVKMLYDGFPLMIFLVKPGRGTTLKAIGDFPRWLSKFSLYVTNLFLRESNLFETQLYHSTLSVWRLTVFGLNALKWMLWLRLPRYSAGIIWSGSCDEKCSWFAKHSLRNNFLT